MTLGHFVIYTFAGSFIWCYALAWIGFKLGDSGNSLGIYFHKFDTAIGIVGLINAAWYIHRHWRHRLEYRDAQGSRNSAN